MFGYHHKRKNYQYQDVYEEQENVDDLEFAANFAILTTPTDCTPSALPRHNPTIREAVDDTLDHDEQDSDSSSESSKEQRKDDHDDDKDDDSGGNKNEDEIDSSEDDESDVDLSRELAQMESDDDEPKQGSKSNRIVVPKTQNELDVYNCPVTELEKTLDLGLELGDALVFEPSESGVMTARVQVDRIRPAGNIKFHMVSDRTIVVESNLQGGVALASNLYNSNPAAKKDLLLDEGNLLLLKADRENKFLADIVDGTELKDNEVFVVPLGKILEVFGPISKPLYTLRLTTVTADRTRCKEGLVDIQKEDGQVNDTNGLSIHGKETSANIKNKDEQVNDTNGLSPGMENSNDFMENSPDEETVLTTETIVAASMTESSRDDGIENNSQQHNVKASINEYIDPWSETGILTKWLKSVPKLEVFYCEDKVKIVDTQTIAKNSKKGCDASNIYDEEVTDEKEVYYSDDEEEKAAKRGKRRQNKNSDNRSSSACSHMPQYPSGIQNKRHPTANPPYSHANPNYHPHPSQLSQQNQQATHYPYHFPNPNVPAMAPQPMRQHYSHFGGPPLPSHSAWMQATPAPAIYTNMMNTGRIPPPPPPPPPRPDQHQSYYSIAPSQQHQIYHQPSQQQNYAQMYHHYNNQTQQQQQQQQRQNQNQENDGTSANNGDTVYYNYSGS